MRVLIVDDESYMTVYIRHLVKWEDYGFKEIITATSPTDAKTMLKERPPQLLITDIRMPGITGLDLAKYIAEQDLPTKTIILSGHTEFDYAKKALKYGVIDYLVKPVLKRDLQEVMEKVTRRLEAETEGIEKEPETADQDNKPGMNNKGLLMVYIKDYINKHYSEPLSLDVLSELVYLHPVYLSRLFKEEMGINLSTYLTRVRMEKAADLLNTTTLKVNDIKELVGYSKTQYFIKLFKRAYGQTPQQYRKRIRGE